MVTVETLRLRSTSSKYDREDEEIKRVTELMEEAADEGLNQVDCPYKWEHTYEHFIDLGFTVYKVDGRLKISW